LGLLTDNDIRNGSAESIKKIVSILNNAILDPNVGTCNSIGAVRNTLTLLEVVIAPPCIYLILVRDQLRKDIEVSAQNCYDKAEGAFTGELAVSQLLDAGVDWTILGHSERRGLLSESDEVYVHGDTSFMLTFGSSLPVKRKLPSMAVLE
jgi:triosephosphate isomerase (TIM)